MLWIGYTYCNSETDEACASVETSEECALDMPEWYRLADLGGRFNWRNGGGMVIPELRGLIAVAVEARALVCVRLGTGGGFK
mmetsp:Transcript_29185/g.64351  ORF Transcript_29185/g.64351 Transcript_29185/m.64351 type:complete len:82 (+) Transcript_29185:1817-2062(+)